MSGLIIPMYGDPFMMSSQVAIAKMQFPNVPVICIQGDTASGSGPSSRSDISEAVLRLKNVGCNVVGYVATGYGARQTPDAKADVARWFAFYSLDGIFFDEVDGNLPYYEDLSRYVKSFTPPNLSIGNPGTSSSQGAAFDFMLTYENAGMPVSDFLGNYIAHTVAVLPVSFPKSEWIYITDDPATYQVLPSYLGREMAALAGAPPLPSASTATLTIAGKSYTWNVTS